MKLGFKERSAYALGAVGKDMAYMLASGYVLYYFQDILGADAWIMGIILLAARILDAFNAPIMGIVVAKTHTRWGRFRPWMLIGTIPSAFLLYLMYAAPTGLSGSSLAAYAAVIYILWGVTYTMMDIPFWSMLPAFTHVGKEREGMTSLSRTAASLGAAFINVLTVKAVQWLGGGTEVIGFRRFALFVAVVFVITILLTCLFIKEQPVKAEQTAGLKEMIKTLVRNDQTMVIVLICVLVNGAMIVSLALTIAHIQGGAAKGDAAVTVSDLSRMILRICLTIIPAAMMFFGALVHRKKYILTDQKMKEITKE